MIRRLLTCSAAILFALSSVQTALSLDTGNVSCDDLPVATSFYPSVGSRGLLVDGNLGRGTVTGQLRIEFPGSYQDLMSGENYNGFYVYTEFNQNKNWNGTVYKENGDFHRGEDWNGNGGGNTDEGQAVYPIAEGIVIASGFVTGYGNMIFVVHRVREGATDKYLLSVYAHLREISDSVPVGSIVTPTVEMATLGKSGDPKYSAHLHLELRSSDFLRLSDNYLSLNKDGIFTPLANPSRLFPEDHGYSFIAANYYGASDYISTNYDSEPPTVPTSLVISDASSTNVELSWTGSSDNFTVAGYKIYRDGTYLKSVTGISDSDTGLVANSQYCYTVSAYDAAGNESAQSNQECATTKPSYPDSMPGPNVGNTAAVPMLSGISKVALEPDGKALVLEGEELSRVDLTTREVTTIAVGIKSARDVAVSADGSWALFTDCSQCASSSDPRGKLSRVDLASGAIQEIAGGFIRPIGIAIENNNSALVIESENRSGIYRVDLLSGTKSFISASLPYSPAAFCLEPGGESVVMTGGQNTWGGVSAGIFRVNLSTGVVTSIPAYVGIPNDIAMLPDGAHVLVLSAISYGPRLVTKVNLSSGATETIYSTGTPAYYSFSLSDIAIRPDGTEAILVGGNIYGSSALIKLNLTNKTVQPAAYGVTPGGIALESDGEHVLVTDSNFYGGLYRLNITNGVTDRVQGICGPRNVALILNGEEAVMTGHCFGSYVLRVNLATKVLNSVGSGYSSVFGIAEETGGTLLVTDGYTSSSGRILRVDTLSGVSSTIASGLNYVRGIAMEGTGNTAIVALQGGNGTFSNTITRLHLETGAMDPLALVASPSFVTLGSSGQDAYVSSDELLRANLETGTVERITNSQLRPNGIVLEKGENTALVATGRGIVRVRIK